MVTCQTYPVRVWFSIASRPSLHCRFQCIQSEVQLGYGGRGLGKGRKGKRKTKKGKHRMNVIMGDSAQRAAAAGSSRLTLSEVRVNENQAKPHSSCSSGAHSSIVAISGGFWFWELCGKFSTECSSLPDMLLLNRKSLPKVS